MVVLSCSLQLNSFPCDSLKSRGPQAFAHVSFKLKGSQASCIDRRLLSNITPRITRGSSRKQFGEPPDGFNRKMGLWRPYDEICPQKWSMTPRNITVRSELAEAGSPDASYSLTEFQLGSRVRGICFYCVTLFTAIFLFLGMMVAHPFVLLFDRYRRKTHHLIAKIWATLTVMPFFKIEYEGLENLPGPDVPAVYVSNHQSFLDIYSLLTLGRNFKFISKVGIFVFPIVGWAMYLLGTIPLKRQDSRSQLDCFKRCMDLLKKGASVFFFSEGTRSKDGKLGAFKKGAFSLAAKTGVPVVPITLVGTGQLMPTGMEAMLRLGCVKVVIHKPIEGDNPDILCDKARNVIASALPLHG